MFDVHLALNLIAHIFSFKKGSPRFPTLRRIFSAFFILPFFLVLIIANRIFMLLDWIFFPGFRKMKLEKTSFIIGVARSATTYLFHILAKDKDHFTSFKLWEILFAPSVIQKYILLGIIKIDRVTGRLLYSLSLFSDRIFLGKIAKLHAISLSQPEEDELLLIYPFASIYLSFFFPGVAALDAHLFFDEKLSLNKRKKIMLFYRRCIQRHVYVFDRKETKFFLSKNPSFVPKMISIAEAFPRAKLIYMLRSPYKTIPSTISLNANVYSVFSGKKKENPLMEKTVETMIQWYKMGDSSINNNWQDRNIIVPFKRITGQPEITVKTIYAFLNVIPGGEIDGLLKTEQENANNYKSGHNYHIESGAIEKQISSQLDFIFEGRYGDEI